MKVAKDKSGVLAGASPYPKLIPKDQERQVTSDVYTEQKLKDQDHQVSSDLSPVEKSDTVSEAVDETEYGHSQGFEGWVSSKSCFSIFKEIMAYGGSIPLNSFMTCY